jgi:hypothetical protein
VIRARTSRLVVLALGLVLAIALPAAASGEGSAGTLQVNDTLDMAPWQTVNCPAGTTGANPQCFAITGNGVVPGLGQTTESYSYSIDDSKASQTKSRFKATISVAGKGTFKVSAATPQPFCTCGDANLAYTITGGTGVFAGASGSGTTTFTVISRHAYWVGTLSVPGYTFDTTPPVFSGAKAKTVKAPKRAKRVRVRYTVTATDAVSGSVPATCKPKSGSKFKIGRTTVTCTATDAVANTATVHFPITVKKRR